MTKSCKCALFVDMILFVLIMYDAFHADAAKYITKNDIFVPFFPLLLLN